MSSTQQDRLKLHTCFGWYLTTYTCFCKVAHSWRPPATSLSSTRYLSLHPWNGVTYHVALFLMQALFLFIPSELACSLVWAQSGSSRGEVWTPQGHSSMKQEKKKERKKESWAVVEWMISFGGSMALLLWCFLHPFFFWNWNCLSLCLYCWETGERERETWSYEYQNLMASLVRLAMLLGLVPLVMGIGACSPVGSCWAHVRAVFLKVCNRRVMVKQQAGVE